MSGPRWEKLGGLVALGLVGCATTSQGPHPCVPTTPPDGWAVVVLARTDCEPCHALLGDLNDQAETFAALGVELRTYLLDVDTCPSARVAARAWARIPVGVVRGPSAWAAADRTPTTLLWRRGKVAHVLEGRFEVERLVRALHAELDLTR